MLELRNKTPFEAIIAPAMDKDCNEFIVLVVKATYEIANTQEALKLADEQVPILLADEYFDEPDVSSIKSAADTAMSKCGTDILLEGSAYNIHGTGYVDTFLRVGPVGKQIRVFGNRHWEKLYGGWQMSMPEKFDTMPMIFENAYGGIEQSDAEGLKKYDDRNPVGKGFYQRKDERGLEGFSLPNLEDPRQLISNWRDKVMPMAYGPVAPHWAPRKTFSGTYDQHWEKTRKPYLPQDFNDKYFSVASNDLISPKYLQGGELVEFRNLSPQGQDQFLLPTQKFNLRYSMKRTSHDAPPMNLDTVVIKPEENIISLTWRTKIPCNRQFLYCDWISLKMVP